MDASGGWVQVVTASGAIGWVASKYLGSAAQTQVTALDVVTSADWQEVAADETSSLAYVEPRETADLPRTVGSPGDSPPQSNRATNLVG